MNLLSDIAGGIPYGWKILWAVEVEGISTLFTEVLPAGAVAPSDYTIAPCLVIGSDAAKVGVVVDRRTGIGRGFDFTLRLRDTEDSRALVTSPSYSTYLTQDLGWADITATVSSTSGWPTSGNLCIGTETIPYTGTTATTFTGLHRGVWGRALDHKAGAGIATRVDSSPRVHVGRRVHLYAVPMDPYGRVHGPDLLSYAAEVWGGSIVDPPEIDGLTWVVRCEPYDRALTRPVAPSASGSLVLTSDVPWPCQDPTATLQILFYGGTPGAGTLATVQPFASWTAGSLHLPSEWREAVALAVASAASTAGVALSAVAWRRIAKEWRLEVQTSDPSTFNAMFYMGFFAQGPLVARIYLADDAYVPPTAAYDWFSTWMRQPDGSGWAGALTIRLEDTPPASIPQAGWVKLEGGGMDGVYAYTSSYPSPLTSDAVTLLLSGATPPEAAVVALAGESDPEDVTATIIYGDEGDLADLLRRLLVSSGRGDGGTYDTLGVGYDFPIDEDGIAGACTGLLAGLHLDLAIEGDGGLAEYFGGLLALSRRAVAFRPLDDGSGVAATVVHVGGSSTAPPVATIDADALVGRKGADPVRPRTAWATPAKITVSLTRAGEDVGKINITDVDRLKTGAGEAWDVSIHGASRASLEAPATLWGQLLMVGEANGFVADFDVAPAIQAEVGDIVSVDVPHFALFQRSTGARGYVGTGRVLGAQTDLLSGIRTLTLLLDAGTSPVAWAPSAPILSWTGSASAPTTITLPPQYTPSMLSFLVGPYSLWPYLPGSDTVGGAVLTVDEVVNSPTSLVLHISSSSGTFTLTTDWRVAIPDLASGNAIQDQYAHDGVGEWT